MLNVSGKELNKSWERMVDIKVELLDRKKDANGEDVIDPFVPLFGCLGTNEQKAFTAFSLDWYSPTASESVKNPGAVMGFGKLDVKPKPLMDIKPNPQGNDQ